jgi:hypothetical protein
MQKLLSNTARFIFESWDLLVGLGVMVVVTCALVASRSLPDLGSVFGAAAHGDKAAEMAILSGQNLALTIAIGMALIGLLWRSVRQHEAHKRDLNGLPATFQGQLDRLREELRAELASRIAPLSAGLLATAYVVLHDTEAIWRRLNEGGNLIALNPSLLAEVQTRPVSSGHTFHADWVRLREVILPRLLSDSPFRRWKLVFFQESAQGLNAISNLNIARFLFLVRQCQAEASAMGKRLDYSRLELIVVNERRPNNSIFLATVNGRIGDERVAVTYAKEIDSMAPRATFEERGLRVYSDAAEVDRYERLVEDTCRFDPAAPDRVQHIAFEDLMRAYRHLVPNGDGGMVTIGDRTRDYLPRAPVPDDASSVVSGDHFATAESSTSQASDVQSVFGTLA